MQKLAKIVGSLRAFERLENIDISFALFVQWQHDQWEPARLVDIMPDSLEELTITDYDCVNGKSKLP